MLVLKGVGEGWQTSKGGGGGKSGGGGESWPAKKERVAGYYAGVVEVASGRGSSGGDSKAFVVL